MLDYSIKVILFQILFLAIYDIFLKKETFFQWNRWYLLVTSFISYIIPLIKINTVAKVMPQEYVIILPEVVLYPSTIIEKSVLEPTQVFNYLGIIYWTGILLTLTLFSIKLLKLKAIFKQAKKQKFNNYFLVLLNSNSAFSFFNYIFLGNVIAEENKQQIIEHELVHVQQKHSIDLLFFELQKIVCWFNPLSYLYQRRTKEVHEFIADAQSIKTIDKTTYFNKLLAETFGVQHLSFINLFFKHSLIKKRIIMLHKNRSKQLLKFKYLLLVPLLGAMLLYSSCEKQDKEIETDKTSQELIEQLKNKIQNKELSDDELKEIFKTIISQIDDQGDARKQIIQEELYKFLLEKRQQVLNDAQKIDYSNADEVPFAVIDKAPVFPGCENAEDTKTCLQENIQKFVAIKFNTSLANKLGLVAGKKRVYVQFKIDKEGNISDVKARGPHITLEEEAKRVINELPQMIPGEQGGKTVGVKYTLPITLMVAGEGKQSNADPKEILSSLKNKPVGTISKYLASIPDGYVYGQLTDGSRKLPGANISVLGTNKKTVTDYDGNFKIEAKEGDIITFNFKDANTKVRVNNNNYYYLIIKL